MATTTAGSSYNHVDSNDGGGFDSGDRGGGAKAEAAVWMAVVVETTKM